MYITVLAASGPQQLVALGPVSSTEAVVLQRHWHDVCHLGGVFGQQLGIVEALDLRDPGSVEVVPLHEIVNRIRANSELMANMKPDAEMPGVVLDDAGFNEEEIIRRMNLQGHAGLSFVRELERELREAVASC